MPDFIKPYSKVVVPVVAAVVSVLLAVFGEVSWTQAVVQVAVALGVYSVPANQPTA